MSKVPMPDPVAYAIFAENGNIRIWSKEPQDLPDLDSLGPMHHLITTAQAEAYKDACVREALEDAQPQWQPIETAPTDQWLLFLDGNETRMESSLEQKHHVDLIKPDRSGETVYAYKHNYTHWMPLPEPPTKEHEI